MNITGRSNAVRPYVNSDGSAFRKCVLEETKEIVGKVGSPVQRVVRFVEHDITEYSNDKSLPTAEEYSLDGLLASGAPLTEVACETLLDSPDVLDLKNQGVGGSLFETLQKFAPKETSSINAPSPSDSPAAAAAKEVPSDNSLNN